MYVDAGLSIPLHSVDAFWRKLDLEPSISVEYGDLNVDHDMQMFKEKFNSQSDHGKYLYLRRLGGITDPSELLINEPSVKKNNRGRLKVKRVQHQSQAPHRYSCSDLNQEPSRHSSSFMDLNDEPARHSSFFMGSNEEPMGQCSYQFEETRGQCSYQIDLNKEPIEIDFNEKPPMGHSSLLNEIPSIFHPYIMHIQNVRGDGNCGFRSVFVCLGFGEDQWLYVHQQLLHELLDSYDDYARVFAGCNEILHSLNFSGSEPAPEEHWMLMPETGILIANKFGVIVNFLTNDGPTTFFPLWKGPEDFPLHRVITIAHVYTNHYVMVQLEEDYPMPPVSVLWDLYKAAPATRWKTKYMSRLFYKKLKPTEKSFMTID